MKIQVLSDLHHECAGPPEDGSSRRWDGVIPQVDSDVIVLAGDIDNGIRGAEWAIKQSLRLKKPVVYVPGNHEYYYQEFFKARRDIADLCAGTDVHLLDKDVWVHAGVRFIGATLWTDYEINSSVPRELAMLFVERSLPDHSVIEYQDKNELRKFLPTDALSIHQQERAWLEQQLAIPFSGKTIVVTHHGPHLCCQHPDYIGSKIIGAFYSDFSSVLERNDIDAWVYGHTHSNLDVVVSGTRILSNQGGYPEEGVHDFNTSFVAKI